MLRPHGAPPPPSSGAVSPTWKIVSARAGEGRRVPISRRWRRCGLRPRGSSVRGSEPEAMKKAYVALLRGVNVGGANRLPMERLRALFVAAGGSDVETLIQSGNVVFVAPEASAREIVGDVANGNTREVGFDPPMAPRVSTAWAGRF